MTKQEYSQKLRKLILELDEPFERYLRLSAKACLLETVEHEIDFDWQVLWDHLTERITPEQRGTFHSASEIAGYLYGTVAEVLILGFLEKQAALRKAWTE